MRALISGQAGIAVLIDGEACSSIEVHSSGSVPRAARDVAYLLGDASDLVELEGISEDDAARELEVAWLKDRSIHLALIALDREAASENRRSAVVCLSDLLKDSPISDVVRNRLYAAPLPPSADLPGALHLAGSSGSTRFAGVLEEVQADQDLIRRSRLAWDALRPDLFGGTTQKERFGFVAVESGMFRLLAQGKYDEALAAFDRFATDHQTGVKWDVRRLAKRWQKIDALAAMEQPTRRPARTAYEAARQRKLPPAVARTAWALAAIACVLLAAVIVSTFLTPVSAKNATALTPPGTGGIMATRALLRSELPFTLRSAAARSHFDEAEKALSEGKFAEAARLYEISGEAVDTLAAKLNFGIALYNTSDLPKAASIFSAGLEIARKKHIAVLEAAFLTNLGNVRREQGHLDDAARLYRDAEEIDRGADALGWATRAYNYGVLCGMLGNFSEALSQFDTALQGYRHLGNKLGEADALLRGLETTSRVPQELTAAAQLYQQIPGPLAEASYHFAIGYREFLEATANGTKLTANIDNRGKAGVGRASDEFKRAYDIYKGIGYRRGEAAAMCSLAVAYRYESNSLEATSSDGQCLSIATEIGSPFLQAMGYGNAGQQDIASGKVSEGLEKFTLASHIAQRIGAKWIEVHAFVNIGAEYARRGELEQAQSYFEKAVKTAEDGGDTYLLIEAIRGVADNCRRLGDADKTRSALGRLRDLYAALGDTTRSAEVQREIDQLRK